MRILVDITERAHFHSFKNAVNSWHGRWHDIPFMARDKDMILQLVDPCDHQWTRVTGARQELVGLMLELLEHRTTLFPVIGEFRPDVLIEVCATFIAHVSWLSRTLVLVF